MEDGAGGSIGETGLPCYDWVLHQQRQALIELKHKRPKQHDQQASLRDGEASPSAHRREPPPKRAKTAGEVLYQAFTDGRLDVASWLADQGVSLDFSQNPALAASASEAFIASLLALPAPALNSAAAAAAPQQPEQQQGPQGSAAAGGRDPGAKEDSVAVEEPAAGAQNGPASAPAPLNSQLVQPAQQQGLPRPGIDDSEEAWARRLAFGGDPNYARHDGMTPLLAAVAAGSAGAVRALLAAGARPDPEPAARAEAISPGQPVAQDKATTSTAAAAEVDAWSSEGAAAAEACDHLQAQQEQHAQAVDAQPQQQQEEGRKKKRKGAKGGQSPAQGQLEQPTQESPPPQKPSQPSPLVLACWAGHLEIARLLIDAGADLTRATMPDIALEVPPHLAAGAAAGAAQPVAGEARGAGAAAAAAVAAMAGQSRADEVPLAGAGSSAAPAPAAEATKQGGQSIVALSSSLCRAGGAGAVAGRGSMTPLMAAVCSGNLSLVETLLKAGASVHCLPDKQDHTRSALWLAVDLGFDEAVRSLVEAGACSGSAGRWITPHHPATPALACAAARGRVWLVELLYPRVLGALQGGDRCVVGQLARHEARHPLAAAAERGQDQTVRRLLELGSSPNNAGSKKRGYGCYTALMLAAEEGHLSTVALLLGAGASPGPTNEREESAASLALQRGHLEIARRCLEASKDEEEVAAQVAVMAKKWHCGFLPGMPPTPAKQAQPPLEQVERERAAYAKLVRGLLGRQEGCARGAPPSIVARAAAGSAALLDALLDSGATLGRHDPQGPAGSSNDAGNAGADLDWAGFHEGGSLPLLHACWFGWVAVERLLERGADVNGTDEEGVSVLLLAAGRIGLLRLGERLLAWPGINLGQVDREGRDALGVALKYKNTKFGELLLRRLLAGEGNPSLAGQAPPGLLDVLATRNVLSLSSINDPHPDHGDSLLLSQVRVAAPKAVKQLLLVPCLDVNVANPRTGCTPLMAAVERGKLATLEALLQTGRVEVNAADLRGCTALLHAARRHNAQAVRLLLAAGADPNRCDSQGDTPLMALARGGQHKPILELAHSLTLGLNSQDAEGMTALMHAAVAGSFNAAKVLRNLGADVLLRDGAGRSAYDLALQGGHAELAVLLKPREQRGAGPGEGLEKGEV